MTDFFEVPAISTPQNFKVEFPQADLDQFHRKLQDARFPDASLFPGLPPAEAEAMEPKAFPTLRMMREIVEYWKGMDLKAFEGRLNTFPHFTTSVDWCKQLHFLHQPSSRPDAIPLILCHGWPGSFMEFINVLKPLSEPEDPSAQAFHVVVPSLPGYTFSSGPPTKKHEVGDVDGYCRLLDALMRGLGYNKYASQGGDWGSVHARVLASRFARSDGTGCRACHLNFLPVLPGGKYAGGLLMVMPEWVGNKVADYTMSEEERIAIRKSFLYNNHGSTYYKVQRDRPSQIGFGLIDSPVALLGYLANFTKGLSISFENLTKSEGPDTKVRSEDSIPHRGQIEAFFPNDETLDVDWLLHETFLYWVTKSAATSFLPYAVNKMFLMYILEAEYTIRVPLGYSGFPNEIIDCPLVWAKNGRRSNSTKFSWYAKSPTGGHLASTEKPEIFVKHLRSAFAPSGTDASTKNASNYGKTGDKGKLFVEGSVWKSGGLWDEERRKSQSKL